MKRAVVLLALVACRPSPPPHAIVDAGAPVARRPDGRLRGHREPITALAISNDGKVAATGSNDRTVRIWDVDAQTQRALLPKADEAVTALAFNAAGDTLAAGNRAFQVQLIKVADGTVIRTQVHPDAVSTVQFSPDGKRLLVAGFGGNAAIYDVETGKAAPCDLHGRTAQFTEDAKHVVLAGSLGALTVVDAQTCKELKQVSTQPQLPFAGAGSSAAMVGTRNGRDATVLLWNALEGKPLGKLEGHQAGITTLQVSGDGKRALTASEDGTVRLWDVDKRVQLKRIDVGQMPFATMTADAHTALISTGIEAFVVPLQP